MASKKKSQKSILFQVFAYYGRQHMVFVCEFLCAFAKFVQKFTNLSQKPVKSYTKLGQSQRKAQINAFMSHSYKFWLF